MMNMFYIDSKSLKDKLFGKFKKDLKNSLTSTKNYLLRRRKNILNSPKNNTLEILTPISFNKDFKNL